MRPQTSNKMSCAFMLYAVFGGGEGKILKERQSLQNKNERESFTLLEVTHFAHGLAARMKISNDHPGARKQCFLLVAAFFSVNVRWSEC